MYYKRVPLPSPNNKVAEWEYEVKPDIRSELVFIETMSRQNRSSISISKSINELTTRI